MHSMLKRKRIQQQNNSATNLHLPITHFQFKSTQKYSDMSQQPLQVNVKKMKKSQIVPIKTFRNSSLPHLSRSQSNHKLNLTARKKGHNTFRSKDKDQIGRNKIKDNGKIDSSLLRNVQRCKLRQDQKENIESENFYLVEKKGRPIDGYERKIKCNKTCYYFHRKDALESGVVEDICLNMGGNRQGVDLGGRCLKRLAYQGKKQISQSLQIEGQKPKWQLFEFGIGTERKFTIRRTGRFTQK